jgi:rhodanese-related sulfurtransferase
MKRKERTLFAIALIVATLPAQPVPWGRDAVAATREPAPVEDLSPKEAAALIGRDGSRKGVIVLDVRTPQEYRDGHIPGAVLIDYNAGGFREEVNRLDREREYIVYCRTGNRSSKAVGILRELGFRSIRHLRGGILEWMDEGLSTVR